LTAWLGAAAGGCAGSPTAEGANAGRGRDAGGVAAEGGAAPLRFDRIAVSLEFYAEGAAFGDFDGDGATDIVSGPYWYRGPDFTGRHEIYAPMSFDPHGYSNNFFAFVHDFNRDGWPDVLVVGFPGTDATWYENPHDSNARFAPHVVADVVDVESPAWVDLTGDGEPELVFATGGYLGWAGPDPADAGLPWRFHPITPAGSFGRFTHGLGVGDLDGDGRFDVLEATGYWLQPASLTGDPVWQRVDQSFGGGGAQMFAYDVDADGDVDVITSLAAHGYGVAWFERTSGGWSQHLLAGETPGDTSDGVVLHEPHALALADLDGDGALDLVTGERFWAHVPAGDPHFSDPAALYWFHLQRASGAARFVPRLIDDASGVGTQLVVGDANGDARPDVLVGNKKGLFAFVQVPLR
jgi:hypothetical protein